MVTLLFALFLVLFALSQTHPEKIPRLAGALQQTTQTHRGQPDPGVVTLPVLPENKPSRLPAAELEPKLRPDVGMTGLGRWLDKRPGLAEPSSAMIALLTPPILPLPIAEPEPPPPPRPKPPARTVDSLAGELQKALADEVKGVAEVTREERGVVVALLDTPMLFASGKAELSSHGRDLLKRLIPVARRMDLPVRIEGHTDNVPIHNSFYASNWELSVMRAAWVTRTFAELGLNPERLAVMGYGDSRPRASNANDAGRSRNRRVEIVFVLNENSIQPATVSP